VDTIVACETDQLHLWSEFLSSFLTENRCFFHWSVKKAQQGLEMQRIKWNRVCSFKNEQSFSSPTLASRNHQYTCTPRLFWIVQKFSFDESDTYYESIKSLRICNSCGSIMIFCLLLLIWVCIKTICAIVVYKNKFQSMININITL